MSETTAPLVSALIPVFNGERFLAEALDSALRQSMDRAELIVINDGSTDNSGMIARQYAVRHPGRIVYREQLNAGLPSARNAAIAVARGRYLALLDSDDRWLPHHLETLVQVLETDSKVGLAHANITFIGDDGRELDTPQGRWANTAEGDAFNALFLRREHVSCPTAVFRRELVLALGGFDNAFAYLGCEDRDLWLRISALHVIRYVPRVTAHYRVHATGMSRNLGRMLQARRLLVEKHSASAKGRGLRRAALASVDAETSSMYVEQGRMLLAAWHLGWSLLRNPACWRSLIRVALSRRPIDRT